MKDVLNNFLSTHERIISSSNLENMQAADLILRKAASILADNDPEALEELVNCYDGIVAYNNYLSEKEAKKIVDKFIHFDDKTGAKWDFNTFESKVNELNGKLEDKPCYNKWALWATANMIWSDSGDIIYKWSGEGRQKCVGIIYELAVSKLKDKDRKKWIRHYFQV